MTQFPGEGNGNPLQYSCLENPMDRGAWWAIAHEAAKSYTRLSTHTHIRYNKWGWEGNRQGQETMALRSIKCCNL